MCLSDATLQLSTRQATLDDKLHHLDKEIHGYKQQMSRMRPGPAKVMETLVFALHAKGSQNVL